MLRLAATLALLLAALAIGVLADRPLPPADFTLINRGDVTTLDVQRMSWMQDLRIAAALWEPLVRNDVFSHEYRKVPAVAESWSVSPDGRTYTFRLRADARWSNGQPVRSSDFRYAWRRGLLPETAGDYTNFYGLFSGAAEWARWRSEAQQQFARQSAGRPRPREAEALWRETLDRYERDVGVRCPDDRTLVVQLERPVPYFLEILAFEAMLPVYPPAIDACTVIDPVTAMARVDTAWTKPPNLVTNGPFMLTSWRFKRDMRLERNPFYWNAAAISVDAINIPSVSDPNASVLAFQTGAVDWVSDVTPDYRGDMVRAKRQYQAEHAELYRTLLRQGLDPVAIDRRMPPDPRQNIHVFPAFGTYFYNFNCAPTLADGRPNPFADRRVRRAFALAVNKQVVADTIRRLEEPVARTLIPPGSLDGYASPDGLPCAPDPAAIDQARRLLAEAGYPDGRGFITVEILFNKDGGHDLIAQSIKKDWERNLGVSVVLQQKEIKVFRADLKQKNYMISRAGWFGDFGDPTTFLEINRTGDGNNDRAFSSPEFDALLAAAEIEPDAAARSRILAQAERLLVEVEVPFIPIHHYNQVYLFNPHRLSGISPHPRQKQSLFRADILGDGKGADTPLELPPRPVLPAPPAPAVPTGSANR